jgi:hypothetical protein
MRKYFSYIGETFSSGEKPLFFASKVAKFYTDFCG